MLISQSEIIFRKKLSIFKTIAPGYQLFYMFWLSCAGGEYAYSYGGLSGGSTSGGGGEVGLGTDGFNNFMDTLNTAGGTSGGTASGGQFTLQSNFVV